VVKSIAAAAAVAGGAAGSVWYAWTAGLWAQPRGDHVSDAEQQERIKAFNALGSMPLSVVSDGDITSAVASMNLPPEANESILVALRDRRKQANLAPAPAQTAQAEPAAASSPVAGQAAVRRAPVSAVASRAPEALPSSRSRASTQLAWVTLWDSDVEDGDAVRIESGGYARTVLLTKRGITFAIPVPPNGQIHLIGVQDGDGGGITVGLASGAAKVILPVMSVGQVLALNVKVN
jgi:hypothetical protein